MPGMMHQLIETMNEQADRYEELLGLSDEKKDIIVKNDVDSLQKITNLESILISQNNKLEKKRISLVSDIAEVLGKRGADLSLTSLAEMLEEQPEKEALLAAGERIRVTLEKLSDLNDLNSTLIKNALDYIEYSLNLMRSTQSDQPHYAINGEPLEEGRATFDATK
jgi:flagellar biosynthesis/type III secretory pathway chaperone